MKDFDLQIQTTASDGKETPAEGVRMAKENGVGTIGMTEEDRVGGGGEGVGGGVFGRGWKGCVSRFTMLP